AEQRFIRAFNAERELAESRLGVEALRADLATTRRKLDQKCACITKDGAFVHECLAHQRIREAGAECQRQLEEIEKKRNPKFGECAWCGTVFREKTNPDWDKDLLAHAKTCAKHPAVIALADERSKALVDCAASEEQLKRAAVAARRVADGFKHDLTAARERLAEAQRALESMTAGRDILYGACAEMKSKLTTIAADTRRECAETIDQAHEALRVAYSQIILHHESGYQWSPGGWCPVCHHADGTEPEMDQISKALAACRSLAVAQPEAVGPFGCGCWDRPCKAYLRKSGDGTLTRLCANDAQFCEVCGKGRVAK
ncbi:hypothetical protein HQ590_02305, partial [bacterium]|nr:hypothetical protein [bacterium]